jgi:hypothetical protein
MTKYTRRKGIKRSGKHTGGKKDTGTDIQKTENGIRAERKDKDDRGGPDWLLADDEWMLNSDF